MKKLFTLLAFVGLLTLSCSKSEIKENRIQNGTYEFTIKASMDAELTKTAYAGNSTFSWSAGDQISVLFNDGAGNNKFYTLTAASGGSSSADFSGTIDAGWSLGASDTGKEWALFPANAGHTYNTTTHLPLFCIAGETDYTASHFSANIPMAAEGDGLGNFAFKHMTGVYKFTFTDVDASKVKFVVKNNGSRPLSGIIPVNVDGSTNYLNYTASGAVGSSTITFIENVDGKTATFYVPYQSWRSDCRPTITLINMDDGSYKDYTILNKTATAALTEANLSKMHVLPSKSAPGNGVPMISRFGIDWFGVGVQTVAGSTYQSGSDDFTAIKTLKVSSTAGYLFLFLEVDRSKLYDADYDYANRAEVYFGDGSSASDLPWMWTGKYTKHAEVWLLQNNVPDLISYSFSPSIYAGGGSAQSVLLGTTCYYEMRIPRSYDACLQGTSAIIAIDLNKKFNDGGSSGGTYDHIGVVPEKDNPAFSFTMPAYVAP